jgi:thiol-disulfide isomerase/thioredoxin
LAVVFTVAGTAKLLDLASTRATIIEFGVPASLADAAGTALPFAELATAVALVVTASARWGAAAALVLLIAFIAGIANVLAHGRTPDCNCFGQIRSAPVSWRTMIRNAVLGALAIVVLVRGAGTSLLSFSGRSAAELIGALAALGLVGAATAMLGLRREKHAMQASLDRLGRQVAVLPGGLPIGTRAPAFELDDVRGGSMSLASLCGLGRPVLLLFIAPQCGPCLRLLPEVGRWHAALSDRITFAVISNGGQDREETAAELRAAGEFAAGIQEGQEIADYYRITSTPWAVMVDPSGRLASGSVAGPDEIEALVRQPSWSSKPSRRSS